MNLETKVFCHKGHKACQFIEDGAIRQCSQYMQLKGQDPQTGEMIDKWDCADKWLITLLLENSAQQRSTGAAIESFRNEMVNGNQTLSKVLLFNKNKDDMRKLNGS